MDDVERSVSPTIVTYGGTVIARLEAGQIATLACARKLMSSNVIIKAGDSSGAYSSVVTDGSALLIRTAAVTREGNNTLIIA